MDQFPQQLYRLSEALLAWYDAGARVLPWRDDPTAYHVWLSEIMLQQTRVSAVLPYYERFLAALPDVAALAAVEEDRLLKLWEGLGYYNRARNLQKAARKIMEEYDGVFPGDYETIRSLPGIGEYTAGAVASIAFGQAVPAVDGNVLRVIARITGDEGDVLDSAVKRRFGAWVRDVLPEDRPGDFNQALMELGAMVCLPNGAPKCAQCPARPFCTACREGTWNVLPVKRKKTPRRMEEKTVFVLLSSQGVALRQRAAKGLLAGLWEFPNVDGRLDEPAAAQQVQRWGLVPMEWLEQLEAKHIFSHVEWHMRGYVLRVRGQDAAQLRWTDRNGLETERAVPAAFAKVRAAAQNALPRQEEET